jgi:DNA polymerase lambda
MKKSSG